MGKLVGLGRTIVERYGPLEADLRRYYQLRLRAVVRGKAKVTARELFNLVANLPADSAIARASDDEAAWTIGEHLVAGVVDELRIANWMYRSVHRKEGAEVAPLELVRRPRRAQPEPVEEAPKATIHDFRRALLGH